MFNKKLGLTLLSVWLIVSGLQRFMTIPVPQLGNIMAILAIAAGVIILLGKK